MTEEKISNSKNKVPSAPGSPIHKPAGGILFNAQSMQQDKPKAYERYDLSNPDAKPQITIKV